MMEVSSITTSKIVKFQATFLTNDDDDHSNKTIFPSDPELVNSIEPFGAKLHSSASFPGGIKRLKLYHRKQRENVKFHTIHYRYNANTVCFIGTQAKHQGTISINKVLHRMLVRMFMSSSFQWSSGIGPAYSSSWDSYTFHCSVKLKFLIKQTVFALYR